MQVRDVMTPSVVTVSREDSAETAAKIMGRHGIGAVSYTHLHFRQRKNPSLYH